MALAHARMDFHLEGLQPIGDGFGLDLFKMGNAVRIDRKLGIGWEARIDRHSGRGEFLPQLIDKLFATRGKPKHIAVFGQPRRAIRPGQELGPIVIEGFGADNEKIAGLQRVPPDEQRRRLQARADPERYSLFGVSS